MTTDIIKNDVKPLDVTLFDTSKPSNVVDKAKEIASTLAPLIDFAKLYVPIRGNKYVKVEGWTTMLAMLGIYPQVKFCNRIPKEGNEVCYEARVELTTMDGKVVGAAEHFCSSKEKSWPEYAVKSMAQTRATGKAARLSFSWIMALAGYETTPLEEMPIETKEIGNDAIEPHEEPKSLDAILTDQKIEPRKNPNSDSVTINIDKVYSKEYSPGKWRYAVKDTEGNWYNTFSKTFYDICEKCVDTAHQIMIEFKVEEYNGKLNRNIVNLWGA